MISFDVRLSSVRYRRGVVLPGCEFRTIGQGLTLVKGRNGTGKTALTHALGGLCRAEGTVSLDGVNLAEVRPPARAAAGLVVLPQREGAFRNLTWNEHLRLTNRPDMMRRAMNAITKEGVPPTRSVRLLSGGQRRSVALAYALSCNPKVLVLDEPTAGLDESTKLAVQDLIGRLSTEIRVVVVEHDDSRLRPLADSFVQVGRGGSSFHGATSTDHRFKEAT